MTAPVTSSPAASAPVASPATSGPAISNVHETARAVAALRTGSAVIAPNPPPLTHVVTATDPAAVNLAKGRPASQPVAVWITTDSQWSELAATLPMDHAASDLARRLLIEEMVTLLIPVTAEHPAWLTPAVHQGHALLFGARWTPLSDLLPELGIRYVSSANRTGLAPVATASQARAMFGPDVPVIEVTDPGPDTPRRATTTVRIGHDRTLELTREGAQDHALGGPDRYLDHLRDRYDTVRG